MTYQEAIDWLYSTQQFGIKLGLEQARRLLRETLALPKPGVEVIHVAGTNGKGSTCAMIDALARAGGVRAGLFTSPHLIDYRERIRVGGAEIPGESVARYLSELKAHVSGWETHPTFFELTLAVAMRYFRECNCELIILETGMGGRLDATTAVPADVAVITPVAMDHCQWLGDTLEAVAAEKAGIIVPGKPVVSGPQEPAARGVIEQEASGRRSPLTWIAEPLAGYPVNLPGPHQKWNAALALAAAGHVTLPLNYDIVKQALATVSWPGRFEKTSLPGTGQAVVLDGAHNEHAARALAETWRAEFPGQKASVVFGAVEGKNTENVLAILAGITEHVHFTPVNSPRALSCGELADALPPDAPPHTCHNTFEHALAAALAADSPALVTGSLFLIGQARAALTESVTPPASSQ